MNAQAPVLILRLIVYTTRKFLAIIDTTQSSFVRVCHVRMTSFFPRSCHTHLFVLSKKASCYLLQPNHVRAPAKELHSDWNTPECWPKRTTSGAVRAVRLICTSHWGLRSGRPSGSTWCTHGCAPFTLPEGGPPGAPTVSAPPTQRQISLHQSLTSVSPNQSRLDRKGSSLGSECSILTFS